MAIVRLPAVLRPLAGGAKTVAIDAADLDALERALRDDYPELASRLLEPSGGFGEFVSVFVDGEDARALAPPVRLTDRSEVSLLPAISGGSSASASSVTPGA